MSTTKDAQILARSIALGDAEHRRRGADTSGEVLDEDEQHRLRPLKVTLDQC